MTIAPLRIEGRLIEPGYPAYIIAEMSANHGQSFDQAVQIVHAAKEAGADAIKLQTYTPDTLTIECSNRHFLVGEGTPWEGKNLYQLYGEAYMPWEWQPKLKEVADDLGLNCFSSPFDATAVDFLEQMNVPAHKIASFELVDLALIRKVAQTGKPTIMSTGMASLAEIDEAVREFREAGGSQLALLKCTSAYPSLPEEMNLLTIRDMAERFSVPVGLSDHTLGHTVAVAAVAIGACIVEKHFTLARADSGPDSAFSMEPPEFRAMVDAIRVTELALGKVSYEVSAQEAKSRIFRRSLFVVDDVAVGEIMTAKNVRCIRPGHGLHPRYYNEVIGKHAGRAISRGTPLQWTDLV